MKSLIKVHVSHRNCVDGNLGSRRFLQRRLITRRINRFLRSLHEFIHKSANWRSEINWHEDNRDASWLLNARPNAFAARKQLKATSRREKNVKWKKSSEETWKNTSLTRCVFYFSRLSRRRYEEKESASIGMGLFWFSPRKNASLRWGETVETERHCLLTASLFRSRREVIGVSIFDEFAKNSKELRESRAKRLISSDFARNSLAEKENRGK